jgi:predicted acyl esterase
VTTPRMRRTGLVLVATLLFGGMAVPAQAGDKGEGTQGRRWVTGAGTPPASISPAQYAFTVQPVQIPMRDGAQLSAVLYLPTGLPADGPKSCVLWQEGYVPPSPVGGVTAALATQSFEDFARRGYATLYVQLRGLDVPADQALYYRYAEDGYDTVEWAAAQDWCDNVGMIGASLDGISAWLPASLRPPHLKALAPQIACGDCYWYLWNRGGTRPGSGRMGRKPPATATDEYAAAAPHRTYDAWWEARNTTAAEHRNMAAAGIPVMQCGGWDDYITPGGMRAIEQMNAGGGTGMNIIGPCSHGGATPTLSPYDYQTFSVLWFDRWLKGIRNGFDRTPEALIYVEGADQYRYEPTWPPSDTHWTGLHLHSAKSGSAKSLNDGSLSAAKPGGSEAPVGYTHDPAGPLNDAGGGGTRPTADQRTDEANQLTWTTPAVTTPTEITGWPRLKLWASSTAPDTDFVAEIADVSPDGTSRTIGRGWLNGPQSFSRTRPQRLAANKVYGFDMELWPMSYVVQKGHRIRLALSGSDSPGTEVNPLRSRVTIYQDTAHQSALQLPIVGTSWKALSAAQARVSAPVAAPSRAAGGSSTGSLAATGAGTTLPMVAMVLVVLTGALRRRRREA